MALCPVADHFELKALLGRPAQLLMQHHLDTAHHRLERGLSFCQCFVQTVWIFLMKDGYRPLQRLEVEKLKGHQLPKGLALNGNDLTGVRHPDA